MHYRYALSPFSQNKSFCFVKLFPEQALTFIGLQYKSFEDTVEKGEIAHNEQFLLFPLYFLPVLQTSCHFHQI